MLAWDIIIGAVDIIFILIVFWKFKKFRESETEQKKEVTLPAEKAELKDIVSKKRYDEIPVKKSDLAIVRFEKDDELKTNIENAIKQLGGIDKFVRKGDKVAIKANVSGGNPKLPGSYTNPKVVKEIVQLIRNQGAKAVVVDADMIWTKFEKVAYEEPWEENGFKIVTEKEAWETNENEIPLMNLTHAEMIDFDFHEIAEHTVIGKTKISNFLKNSDVIISVPVMKTHLLTDITIGMKNMYGTFPEEDKGKYHKESIEEVIYEVNKLFTPHLTIIDGTTAGEGMGPLSVIPLLNYNLIIASNDVVAADSIATSIMGIDPSDVQHLKYADERGLGNIVKIDKNSEIYKKITPHDKDFNWTVPTKDVVDMYEKFMEVTIDLHGVEGFFNDAADFVLYDLATHPLTRDFTREAELFGDHFIGYLMNASKPIPKDLKVLGDWFALSLIGMTLLFLNLSKIHWFILWGEAPSYYFAVPIFTLLLLATAMVSCKYMAKSAKTAWYKQHGRMKITNWRTKKRVIVMIDLILLTILCGAGIWATAHGVHFIFEPPIAAGCDGLTCPYPFLGVTVSVLSMLIFGILALGIGAVLAFLEVKYWIGQNRICSVLFRPETIEWKAAE